MAAVTANESLSPSGAGLVRSGRPRRSPSPSASSPGPHWRHRVIPESRCRPTGTGTRPAQPGARSPATDARPRPAPAVSSWPRVPPAAACVGRLRLLPAAAGASAPTRSLPVSGCPSATGDRDRVTPRRDPAGPPRPLRLPGPAGARPAAQATTVP